MNTNRLRINRDFDSVARHNLSPLDDVQSLLRGFFGLVNQRI